MLVSETRTEGVEKRIKEAAIEAFGQVDDLQVVFEHGQWWVLFYEPREDGTRTFSVCDAEGVGSIDGFDFEEV